MRACAFSSGKPPSMKANAMRKSAGGDLASREAEVRAARVQAAFEQIPVAAIVTAANSILD